MRADGSAQFYLIQHKEQNAGGRWAESHLEGFLFDNMSYQDKRGEKGDRYRALINPQSASCSLWQEFGVNGFENESDALECWGAMQVENPGREFRIVRRTITQMTEIVR